MKIVFVCSGNTCRSPMAEGLAKKYFPREFKVFSAGINAYPGCSANDKAILAMSEKGIDITTHKAVMLDRDKLASADLVIVMTKDQQQYLLRSYSEYKDKITVIAGLAGKDQEIPDPWGGSQENYRRCAQDLEDLIIIIAAGLKKRKA